MRPLALGLLRHCALQVREDLRNQLRLLDTGDDLELPTTVTDALNQTTDYTYNTDNTLATVSYSAQQATPSVSFTYDPVYPRRISMIDGIGTTTYSYYPVSLSPTLGANQLQSITSPIAGASGTDTMVYTYDALNRVVGFTINGAAQSIGFDALGRVTSASSPLDSFTYSYSDGTPRVTGVSSNAGPTVALAYFGPTGDELLQQLNINTNSGGTSLAQFGYTYNADNNVESLAVSSPSAQTTTYTYDTANRLISALIGTGSPQYVYGYDHASNLTSITPNGATESFSYTSTNAITTGTYDANGSPEVLSGNSYKWDGANRLVRFANSANNTGSSFTYDGLGRLVRVVDTNGGAVIADHSYTWCDSMRCLAHDNTQSGSPVSTQYFAQGAIIGGTPYYYVKDQLGSVTQLVTSTGTVASQYAYDPYGNRTLISGTLVSDIGYAGYFYHAASGLEFTLHRAYDPTHARWLNRDPIGVAGGINLYAYAGANPSSLIDPLGFCPNPNQSVWSLLASSPGLLAIVIATEVAGGGPEDPIADAAVAAEIAAAEAAAAGPAATLELAQQISSVPWGPTVALLETAEGPTLVASGEADLSASQIALAESLGLTVANAMPGFDAEITLINSAGEMGLTPTTGVATNIVCPSCAAVIQELGGSVSGRFFSF